VYGFDVRRSSDGVPAELELLLVRCLVDGCGRWCIIVGVVAEEKSRY
jgi:hypothetical protein